MESESWRVCVVVSAEFDRLWGTELELCVGQAQYLRHRQPHQLKVAKMMHVVPCVESSLTKSRRGNLYRGLGSSA